MKIIHILPRLDYGGAEKVCVDLCNYMAKQGNEVILCLLCDHTDQMRDIDILDKRVKLVSLGKRNSFDLSVFFKMKTLIDELNPAVIHAHMVGLFYLFKVIVSGRKNIFYTVHNMAEKDAPAYYRIFYKLFFKRYQVHPIAVSESVRDSVAEAYQLNDCAIIYNGAAIPPKTPAYNAVKEELHQLGINNESAIFVCLARIHPQKRIELLLKSFNKLLKVNAKAFLLILGDVSDNDYYTELMEIKGKSTFFLGAKKNVYDYLYQADALCLTSLYEGLPIVIIEAMAAEVIPVTVPITQLKEIIEPDKNGIFSETDTVDDYMQAMQKFIQLDDKTRNELRRKAFETFNAKFSIASCGDAYLQAYNNYIN